MNTCEAFAGYNLFSPMDSGMTYLMDNAGNVIHSWKSDYSPGESVYLLENGHLLRPANLHSEVFNTGGTGGRVEEYTWDGELVWEFEYSSPRHNTHHDVEKLPNGHVLLIAWEIKSVEEMLAAGRAPGNLPTLAAPPPTGLDRAVLSKLMSGGEKPDPNTHPDGARAVWVDHIIEVDPGSNEIVWEWHLWDHLVQDYDPHLPNYGDPALHPELVDINFIIPLNTEDWNHINSIDYHPDLDQILVSSFYLGEIWIIDHSTTTAEAAGHAGGRSGRGGDLLYRWGNPLVYRRGTDQNHLLWGQHDAEWIEAGSPGAGNILIFNDGVPMMHAYSTVEEITPPLNADGSYTLNAGAAYGPDAPTWRYAPPLEQHFFADHVSGAQRLPNGDTLICDGPAARFFEITPDGALVWEYQVPPTADELKAQYSLKRGVKDVPGIFRVDRYPPDDAGLQGHDLTPQRTLE